MSVLASIKEERRLSFSHWRYRVLHWCFGINPENPRQSPLPDYLYSHYCPLFHVTNLIALLSPLILGCKVTVAVMSVLGRVICEVIDNLGDKFTPVHVPEKVQVDSYVRDLQRESALMAKHMMEGTTWHSFDTWWANFGWESDEAREELKAKHAELLPKVVEAMNRREEKKKRLQQKLLFWINFSQIFVKWAMYAFYAALGVGVVYLCFWIAGPLVQLVLWLLTFNPIPLLLAVAKFSVLIGGVVLLYMLAHRAGLTRSCRAAAAHGFDRVIPPVVLLVSGCCAGFNYARRCAAGVVAFTSMFYEQNCPPIKIVSGEDAMIEEAMEEC